MENFTAIPNEWFDHYANGRLTPPMFDILCYLKRTCTWSTGEWRGEAERIRYGLNKAWSVSQINRYLARLHNCRYIDRQNTPGRRGGYKILINNYAYDEKVLRPTESKDWRDIKDADAQQDASDDACEMRLRCAGHAPDDACEMRSNLDVPDVDPDEPDIPNVPDKAQSVTQSSAPAAPSLSVGDSGREDDEEEAYRVYTSKGYPLVYGNQTLMHSLVLDFYEKAGSDAAAKKNECKDVMAAWALLSKIRYDEAAFVMDMVLSGRIPYYAGRRRPRDFFWFAEHYDHARTLAEETVAEVAAKQGRAKYEVLAPWNWDYAPWLGFPRSNYAPRWPDCSHEHDGKPAVLPGTDWCWMCGCPEKKRNECAGKAKQVAEAV